MATRSIGQVTTSSTGGAGIAGAVAVIAVWLIGLAGVEVPSEVSAALATVLAGVGALVGGWLVPGASRAKHAED